MTMWKYEHHNCFYETKELKPLPPTQPTYCWAAFSSLAIWASYCGTIDSNVDCVFAIFSLSFRNSSSAFFWKARDDVKNKFWNILFSRCLESSHKAEN